MHIQVEPKGWVIFTKESCAYCRKAKALVPEAVHTSCDEYLTTDRTVFLEKMDKLTGCEYRTFPMVFHDRVFVGGHAEMVKYIERLQVFEFGCDF